MTSRAHNEALRSYVDKHRVKTQPVREPSTRGQSHNSAVPSQARGHRSPPQTMKSARSRRLLPLPSHVYRRHMKNVQIINELPDELLLGIFVHLGAGDLLNASLVCKRWFSLTSDNWLWKKIYRRFARKKKGCTPIPDPPNPHPQFWKAVCTKHGFGSVDKKRLLNRKKINPFTGLLEGTAAALKKAGSKWCLVLEDSHQKELSVLRHSDVSYFTMSVSVRWLEVPPISLHQARTLKIYAIYPVWTDKSGAVIENSPHRRSLIYKTEFHWSRIKSTLEPLAADEGDIIDVYTPPDSGLLLAMWKDGGQLAFVTACFHEHGFLERCLLGKPSEPYYVIPHRFLHDDIDRKLGLHSYYCTLELRNHKSSIWKDQFRNLHCRDGDRGGGRARFHLIRDSEQRSVFRSTVETLWKTCALRGRIKNIAFLDITLLAEESHAVWCTSVPVKLAPAHNTDVDYDFADSTFIIHHSSPSGGVRFSIKKDGAEFFITALHLDLSLSFINAHFGTNY